MDILTDNQSLTEKLEADIRSQFESGALKYGMRLLPERELALKYKLSRGTVRKVLLQLTDEGLLHRNGRRGTRICSRVAETKTISFSFFSSLDFSSMASNPYFNDIYRGMEQEAIGMGWDIALQTGKALKGRLALLKNNRNHWADGIILAGADIPSIAPELAKTSVPFVVVDYPNRIQSINSVFPDNINGGYMAVSHLRELKHRKIGFVYPLFDGETAMQEGFKARFFGYQDAMGDKTDSKLLLGVNVGTDYKLSADGEAVLRKYLSVPNRPTAVFVPSDSIMPEIYRIAGEMKLRIPEDFSVVGFEGLALSEKLVPSLTTIHVDRVMMGRLAVQRLKAIFEGATTPVSQMLPVKLIVRNSTKRLN